jgi:dihydrofolate reductase
MKAIIAVNKKGVIGRGDKLPWRCSEDLKHFKTMTMGTRCLVGRKTWEAMPPLEGRDLVIVGKSQTLLDVALTLDIDWVIGGKSIYEQTLHLCNELHISIINDYSYQDGDVMCPDLSTFNGETFIYNFEPNAPKNPVPNRLAEILRESNMVKDATNLVDWVNSNVKMNTNAVCRHDIFEQKLIQGGMSPEQASRQLRFISCPCPKCRVSF